MRGRIGVLAGLLLAVLVGGSAIGVGGQPARPAAAHPGKATYTQYCATCHGDTGQGDGPGAAALPIKPPPFTDGRLMNPLPDDFLFKVVGEGAGSVGLAPQMPAFRPPLTDRQIRDVIGYVRPPPPPPRRRPPWSRGPRRRPSRSSSATWSTRARSGSTASTATRMPAARFT